DDVPQYLAEWKPLHSVLSATVYAELKAQRRGAAPSSEGSLVRIAAFGDPQYPSALADSDSAAAADPLASGRIETSPDVRLRGGLERGLFDWQALPNSRWEVEEIARLFPEGARVYLGAEATEERAKSVGGEAQILHFATHGHVDDRLPLSSAVALTIPSDWTPGRDNGLLQVWEILERVRLDADLVVLSACATALGQARGGEGLVGLTRAFQYAGARSVAASLWNVADSTTAALMTRFYRHLQAGKTKDEALRQAQVDLIRGPIEVRSESGSRQAIDASAPYYWAAFQVFGDWR
ncbi:MAG: CHAT domain-containing protein, partial [Acidobacteriota bacterium]